MNSQPHQRQFAHQYAGPSYPQQQQHLQNPQAQPAPEPCYNCGSPQHVAQHCREARRAVPAGSLNQAPRPQRGAIQKRNNKPVVTRFAPPPNYANGYPQQPSYPQTGPYQPPAQIGPYQPPHLQQQQPVQQWHQQASPQGYPPTQPWQQPYGPAAPVVPPPQAPAYGPHQPVSNYGYNQPTQPAQPAYPRQHNQPPYGGYTPQSKYTAQAQAPQPAQPHYNPPHQAHPPGPYPPHQNYQQYSQQPPVQPPYTPATASFSQTQHHGHGPQNQFPQTPAANGVAPAQQQPPPPKPPPCFPSLDKNAAVSSKNGVIIWRPAQPTETPLDATFQETEEQGNDKKTKENPLTKYFDSKGRRINRDFYGEGSEIMKDPIWESIRTGGSMLAQPLEWELPDEPEEEVKVENEAENTQEEKSAEVRFEETDEPVGSEDTAEKKIHTVGDASDPKNPCTRQPVTTSLANTSHTGRHEGINNLSSSGARGRTNGINQGGKRKSRSPLDNSRPQKQRVRDTTVKPLPQPSHHPLPPKPVTAPPPAQHFNQNRPQNTMVNRRGGHKSQRAHPYARRSASPVRHFLVDTQSQQRGGYRGGGNRKQQGVPNT
ncbi:hypothetical protein DFP73DRAFT_595516 [Morchella snyderi]|nr:hypothetical protein DFP73DRAFT_595516 [Morchella snyderi]